MSVKKLSVLLGVLVVVSMVLTACPAPAPQVVEKVVTQVVKEEVKVIETQVVEKEVEKIVTQVVETVKEVEKPAAEEWTTPHPILSDLKVRQAIAHCTDRNALIASVYPYADAETQAALRMDSFIPKDHWAYGGPYDDLDYAYDVEKAGALLDEAGWKLQPDATYRTNEAGESLVLTLTTTNAQFRQTFAAVMEQNLLKCGIQLIRQHTPASWWFGDTTGLARREFELGLFAWVGQTDPSGRTLYACDQIPLPSNNWEGQNSMGWCNPVASDAIVKANNTLVKEERIAAYDIVQREFIKDMVSLPLFNRLEGEAWSLNLEGVRVDPTEYGAANAANWKLTDGGDTMVIAFSQEPASMYGLVESAAVQRQASQIGGNALPYTQWSYDFQPYLQELSTIEAGLATNESVDVKAGDKVYSTSGEPVELAAGVKVFNAAGEEVEWDGSAALQMKQLVVDYKLNDYTWSDGTAGSVADMELGAKNDCDPESGAVEFITCNAILETEFATDALEVKVTYVPGYQNPTYFIYPWYVYPSHQVLADGRKLADVPAAEWATLPEIAEMPLSWGPFQLTEWNKGENMTFTRNEHFFGAAPALKTVIIQIFPDTQTAVAALLGGDVDYLEKATLGAGAEVQTVLDAAEEGKVNAELSPNPTWEHVDFNLYVR